MPAHAWWIFSTATLLCMCSAARENYHLSYAMAYAHIHICIASPTRPAFLFLVLELRNLSSFFFLCSRHLFSLRWRNSLIFNFLYFWQNVWYRTTMFSSTSFLKKTVEAPSGTSMAKLHFLSFLRHHFVSCLKYDTTLTLLHFDFPFTVFFWEAVTRPCHAPSAFMTPWCSRRRGAAAAAWGKLWRRPRPPAYALLLYNNLTRT